MKPSRDPLTQAILDFGFPDRCSLLVAASGGPDSTALLHAVTALASDREREWVVCAGHVNHGLRGAEADGDEAFVSALAESLGLPAATVRVDTTAHAHRNHDSIETAARNLRYAALEDMRSDYGADFIVTGHTLDDQAETVMMHAIRGAGLTGLGGMPPMRGNVARPFLGVRHDAILGWLHERGLAHRVDSSNQESSHARNRLRHTLMPALDKFSPASAESLASLASLAREDSGYLRDETSAALDLLVMSRREGFVRVDARLWRSLHRVLQRSTLHRLLGDCLDRETEVSAQTVERAAAEIHAAIVRNASVDLSGPIRLNVRNQSFDLEARVSIPGQVVRLPVECPLPGHISTPSGNLTASRLTASEADIQRLVDVCGPFHALCDPGSLQLPLTLRTRLPGDRIKPLGAPGTRKLQDVLVDRRVPADERDALAVICDASGVIWVAGHVLADRVAIRGDATEIIHLVFTPAHAVSHGRMRA